MPASNDTPIMTRRRTVRSRSCLKTSLRPRPSLMDWLLAQSPAARRPAPTPSAPTTPAMPPGP